MELGLNGHWSRDTESHRSRDVMLDASASVDLAEGVENAYLSAA
jgi:hypothetical protein